MYDLLHKQTVEKGLDPRQYALFAYGGTAGMHMTSIGPDLGVSEIVIPHTASVQGAFGLVSADVVYADVTSRTVRFSVDPEEINDIFDVLAAKVLRRLTVDNFGRDDVVLQRTVDMRYQRQVHAITTPIKRVGPLTSSDLDDLTARFHALYAERYGDEAGYREAGVELVAFAVRAIVRLERPRLRNDPIEGTSPVAALVENRLAYFGSHGIIDARCYDFDLLRPGNQVEGPAIIWTPITTIVVHPGQNAVCDGRKNVVISWGKKADQVRSLATEASLAAG
jgi:N-methylhydantoinase A